MNAVGMANKAPDKMPTGSKLDALTAEKVSAGTMFTSTTVRLWVRSRIRALVKSALLGSKLWRCPIIMAYRSVWRADRRIKMPI
jgi:hypothetical protein